MQFKELSLPLTIVLIVLIRTFAAVGVKPEKRYFCLKKLFELCRSHVRCSKIEATDKL